MSSDAHHSNGTPAAAYGAGGSTAVRPRQRIAPAPLGLVTSQAITHPPQQRGAAGAFMDVLGHYWAAGVSAGVHPLTNGGKHTSCNHLRKISRCSSVKL